MPGIDGAPEPERTTAEPATEQAPSERRCPWCSTVAPADATHCRSCGASLAERESLGGMAIPGVTEVDPAVKVAEQMARARARNATTATPHVLGPLGGVAGGTLGFAIGSAIDSFVLGKVPDHTPPPRPLDPSQTTLRMAERLDRSSADAVWSPYEGELEDDTTDPSALVPDPWADLPEAAADQDGAAGSSGTLGATDVPDEPAAPVANELTPLPAADPWPAGSTESPADQAAPTQPTVMDPWADLPPASIEEQIAGTEFDPWATQDDPGDARFDPWAAQNQPGGVNDPWAADGGPWSEDPWATEGGPWSQDPWAGGDSQGPKKPG
jgi:hypothetical protein